MSKTVNLNVRGTIVKAKYDAVFSPQGHLHPICKLVEMSPRAIDASGCHVYVVDLDPALFRRLIDYVQYGCPLFEGLGRDDAIRVSAVIQTMDLRLPGVRWDPAHCGQHTATSDDYQCATILSSSSHPVQLFGERMLAVQPLDAFKIHIDWLSPSGSGHRFEVGFASRFGSAEYVIPLAAATRFKRVREVMTLKLDRAEHQVTLTSEACGTKTCTYGNVIAGKLYPCILYLPIFYGDPSHFQARLLAD
ncbi:hypothetical protein SDRG_08200 [Saprolegnia diclina VS20]|uniref:Potassium channel tetramerisation-type BTB domain-containing protein n=1 Tax=Saprolegnia diclina (strain VS20) TaxID=1156394 RepID=T0QKV8_SAPDV|nr:hypothetical protein SDRG_08200 [Saprolegnia diclina VS20]EQC34430.1 hypothetical protein SDRG_08200 [Saprolegnia diclina VS20]|eukprot:XP_008612292.1 hypothetical protein SDRG_08200 [Saprolegnia diclina VS20]